MLENLKKCLCELRKKNRLERKNHPDGWRQEIQAIYTRCHKQHTQTKQAKSK